MNADRGERLSYDVFSLASIRGDEQLTVLDTAVRESLSKFECGRSEHLQRFARERVDHWEAHGHLRTYVMIVPTADGIEVAALFAVGMAMLDLTQAADRTKRRLMGNVTTERTGAYSIAELARDDRYSSAQLPGPVILDEAKNIIKKAQPLVGGRFVVVDSRLEVFEHLYQPAGFRQIGVAEPPRGQEEHDFVTSCCVIKDWK